MLKGIIVIETKTDPIDQKETKKSDHKDVATKKKTLSWRVLSKYIPESDDEPKNEIIDLMLSRFIGDESLEELNFRQFPYKYHISIIGSDEKKNTDYYKIYILNTVGSLELVKTSFLENKQKIFKNRADSKILFNLIREIFANKVSCIEKLEQVEVLTKELSNKANKMIDEGNFVEAQDYIKINKDIPPKFIEAFEKGIRETKLGNYKPAEKLFTQCHDMAKKLGDIQLQTFLVLKVKTIRQIPTAEKEVKSLLQVVGKELGKKTEYLPYYEQLKNLTKAICLLDKLEEDTQIEELAHLENLLVKANALVNELKSVDEMIKLELIKEEIEP